MAITILKRGRNPEEQPIRATCQNCKAEFTFLPSDAKRVPDQRDGDFYQIVCPCCPTVVTRAVNVHGDH